MPKFLFLFIPYTMDLGLGTEKLYVENLGHAVPIFSIFARN